MSFREKALPILGDLRSLVESLDFTAPEIIGTAKQRVAVEIDRLASACELVLRPQAPLPMVLHCPKCGLQHVDEPEPENGWTNPPHRSHRCHEPTCLTVWRPADVHTVGVAAITTKGDADTWP